MDAAGNAASSGPRAAHRDPDTVAQLRRIVGDSHVLLTDGDVEPYSRDATPLFRARPDAVVLPATTSEVSAILRLATERGIPCLLYTSRCV